MENYWHSKKKSKHLSSFCMTHLRNSRALQYQVQNWNSSGRTLVLQKRGEEWTLSWATIRPTNLWIYRHTKCENWVSVFAVNHMIWNIWTLHWRRESRADLWKPSCLVYSKTTHYSLMIGNPCFTTSLMTHFPADIPLTHWMHPWLFKGMQDRGSSFGRGVYTWA